MRWTDDRDKENMPSDSRSSDVLSSPTHQSRHLSRPSRMPRPPAPLRSAALVLSPPKSRTTVLKKSSSYFMPRFRHHAIFHTSQSCCARRMSTHLPLLPTFSSLTKSTSKPKNARAKRAMAKREPQQNENPKTTLFVTGQKTSNILKLAVADLCTLKRPFVERFSKKNDIHPFSDVSCTCPHICSPTQDLGILTVHSTRVLLAQK